MDEDDIGGVVGHLLPRHLCPAAVVARVGADEFESVLAEHLGDPRGLRGVVHLRAEVRQQNGQPVLLRSDLADPLASVLEGLGLVRDLARFGVLAQGTGDGGILGEHRIRALAELDRDEVDEFGDLARDLLIPPGPSVALLIAVGDEDVRFGDSEGFDVELHVGADDLDAL